MGDRSPPLTQHQSGVSQVKYGSIFLFSDDINNKNPFSIVPLKFFETAKDFPWSSITGEMSSESRAEVRTFSTMPGQFRIFGKIEQGNIKLLFHYILSTKLLNIFFVFCRYQFRQTDRRIVEVERGVSSDGDFEGQH